MDLEKIKALEAKLSQLKVEQEAGTKSRKEYIAEVQKLEFVDETTKDTWRLNSEDGLWYVAAAGSKQLKLAKPQPGKVEDAPVAPGGTSEEGAPTSTSEPSEKVTTEPPGDAPSSGRQNTSTSTTRVAPVQPDSGFGAKFLIIGLGIVAALIIVLFVAYRLIGSSGGGTLALNTPTPASTATGSSLAGSTALPTQPPTDTPTAAPIVSQPKEKGTPLQIPATNTAPPTDELTSTPLPSSTVAPTFTPSPTDTPLPIPQPTTEIVPTEEPTRVISGKLAYAYFDSARATFVVEVKDLLTNQLIFTKTQASQPALNSDGSRLAYHSWQPDRVGLYTVALDNPASQNTLSNHLKIISRQRYGV